MNLPDKTHLIFELPPFTVCKTAHSKNPVYYILISSDDKTFTVYTNEKTKKDDIERKGFVMNADKASKSKQIKVEVVTTSPGYFKTLIDFEYADKESEKLRYNAIAYLLKKNEEDLKDKPKVLEILKLIKTALVRKDSESLKKEDEDEQEELIKEIEKNNFSKAEILEGLTNLKATDTKTVIINSKSFKRDNQTIAQIKFVRGFNCQICGYSVIKKDGGNYIEAAHIEPKYLKGMETLDNIILLCPNHHKEFDLGDRKIIKHTKTSVEFSLNGKSYFVELIPQLP